MLEYVRDHRKGNLMDDVNNPKHYQGKTLESIDVIEDFSLNFHLGNAVKYILRCNKKEDKVKDLQKAVWYLQREIEKTKAFLEPSVDLC